MITAIIANTQAADFCTIDAGPDAFVLFRDLEPDHPKPRREFSCLTRQRTPSLLPPTPVALNPRPLGSRDASAIVIQAAGSGPEQACWGRKLGRPRVLDLVQK